jgi:putative ABC transport system permease protein
MTRIPGLKRFFRVGDARRLDLESIDDELRFHIESRVDELVSAGHGRAEAQRVAASEFGDVSRYRADCVSIDSHHARELHMREFIESVVADLHHAARSLRAQPGFAIVAIATLALGIGATTSVFSAVDGALLRPLPYANVGRIVHVGEQEVTKQGRGSTTSFENYDDWRKQSTSFAAIGIVSNASPTLTGQGDAARIPSALVSAGMFDVFGIHMHLGRPIVNADNERGAPPVVVLTYEFWQSRFGGDPAIVDQSILLNSVPVRVIGVLPKGFSGPGRLERALWSNFIPNRSDGRAGRSKEVYALLRAGVSVSQAQREMTRIAADLATTFPQDNKDETVIVDPLADRAVADVKRPLYTLLGASFFVLLIACANLSNLLLARGTSRSREIAVRSALGADRGRIARQLLTESLLLALLGAIAGVAIAAAAIRTLVAVGPALFATRPPALSPIVLAGSIAVSCATVLLFGLLPALRLAPRDPRTALRDASTRVVGTRGSLRSALAVAQLSLAVVLLCASTLVVKSFVRVLEVDAGIRRENLLTVAVTLPFAKYDSLKSTMFYQQITSQLKQLSEVRDAAVTSLVPFGGSFDRVGISQIAGEPDRIGASRAVADRYVVSATYFQTMGVRLVKGRLIDAADRVDTPTICVVDEVFARRTFGGQDVVGRQVKIPGPSRADYATIVGVVTHVKTYGLDVESPGQIYLSNEQFPWRYLSVVVRTVDDPKRVAPAITRIVHGLDADQPVSNAATMDELMAELLRGRRFILILLSSFAAVAVTLAAIGLYGVIAYGISQRRRELGVRLALGAQRAEIARMVVAEGGRIALAGAVIGTLASAATGRFLGSFLFEVKPVDAAVYSIVVAGLIIVAIIACLVPAHRATTVDAAEVLRGD